MRVLAIYSVKKFLVTPAGEYYTYGGFGSYVEEIAKRFEKVILCIHAKDIKEQYPSGYYHLDIPNVIFKRLPWYRNELECLIKLPWMLLKSIAFVRNADIVNARVPDYSGICGALAARIMKKPIFYNVIGDWAEMAEDPPTKLKGLMKVGLVLHLKLYVWLEEKLLSESVAFVQGQSAYARHMENIKAKLVVSTSITKTMIGKSRRDACSTRPITILSVGRLHREKGHIYLFDAFRELIDRKIEVRLHVIGSGPLFDEFTQWIKNYDLEEKVKLSGLIVHGPDLLSHYRKADIFVLPSISEGTPKVLLEAMASGLPVIASDVGGVSTMVKHGVNGFLVPGQDSTAICHAVISLLENETLRKTIINNGYIYAGEHTSEKEMERMMSIVTKEFSHVQKE